MNISAYVSNSVGEQFNAGHDHFDALSGPLWDRIGRATVAVTCPEPGERIMDACCGAGASAVPAAEAVGPDGRVDAVDLADRLLALGRSRAAGLSQLRFHHADVASWAGGPYDAVQCVLGIFFLPDMAAGVRAMARQLRPGGRFVATVWHEKALAPLSQLMAAAVAPEAEAAGPAAPLMHQLKTPEALTDVFHAAGLRDVKVTTAPLTIPLNPELAWSWVLGSALRTRLAGLDANAVERTRLRFQAALDTDELDVTTLIASASVWQ